MREQCTREADTLQALRSAAADPVAVAHLSDCESCRGAVMSDDFMRQLNEEPLTFHQLPPSSLLWLKAQLLQNQETGARAARRLLAVQYLPLGLIAVLWPVLLLWKWKTVYDGFRLLSLERILASPAMGSSPLPLSVVMMFAVMLGLTALVMLQGIFVEE